VAEELVRVLADISPAAIWLGAGVLGLLTVCLLYLGIVIVVAIRTSEREQQQYLLEVIRELAGLIRDLCRGRRGWK
jgi:hypothetical protein